MNTTVKSPKSEECSSHATSEGIGSLGNSNQPGRVTLLVACLFWLLCLTLTAAGHRLYKSTVALDRQVSEATYRDDGAAMNWIGHGTADQYANRVLPEGGQADVTRITVLKNSPFLLGAIAFYTFLAIALVWSGRWIQKDGTQSLFGLFAGHFLWLGAVEFGLAAVGRRLGLAGSMEVVQGRLVGTHGGGILIQMSAVFLIPMLIGWTFHESNRCVVFQWFRRRLPLVRASSPSGRVDNFAARTAIQYFMTVWFCYVAVLWLADPRLGQFGQYGLLAALIAIALGTPYLIWRTSKQAGRSQALRYSVSGSVVAWTGIEIAAAMRFFQEPWLSNSLLSALVLLGLSVALTIAVLCVLSSKRGSQLTNTKLAATASTVLLPIFLFGGCSDTEPSAALSGAEIATRLREYDGRIQKPPSKAQDGLLHALSSDDPEARAQAALAFGKLRRVSADVAKRLRTIAESDNSRLAQFAAFAALRRLKLLTPDLRSKLTTYRNDPAWSEAANFVGLSKR